MGREAESEPARANCTARFFRFPDADKSSPMEKAPR